MEDLEKFVNNLTTCYQSKNGCFKIPVRVVAVIENNSKPQDVVSMFCLCRNHSIVFQIPAGEVLMDKILPIETIKQLEELGI